MRRVVVLASLVVAAGCDDCVEEPVINVGEGEGEALPIEGEGEEGEGEAGEEGEGDGGEGEGEGEAGEGEGEGEGEVCDVGALVDVGGDDKPRPLLVTFPFGAEAGDRGDVVRGYLVSDTGAISAETDRVNVGFLPERVEILPSGTMAVVAGESFPPAGGGGRGPDQIATLDLTNMNDIRVVDTVSSGVFGVSDLVVSSTVRDVGGVAGAVVYLVNFDSGTGSTRAGVNVVTVGCDGALAVDVDAGIDLRLASSLALLPGDRAFVVGGQVNAFAPTDVNDTRLLGVEGGDVVDLFDFDFWGNGNNAAVNTARVGAAGDGSFVVVANASIAPDDFGLTRVFDVDGDVVTLRGTIGGFGGTEAVVAPDGSVAAVSNFEDNALHILDVTGGGDPVEVRTLTNLGLADALAVIERGDLAGRLFVPVTAGTGGSSIVSVDLGGGDAVVVGTPFSLGSTSFDLPQAIAIAP